MNILHSHLVSARPRFYNVLGFNKVKLLLNTVQKQPFIKVLRFSQNLLGQTCDRILALLKNTPFQIFFLEFLGTF